MTDIPRRSLATGAGLLLGAMAFPAFGQQLATSMITPRIVAKPLTFNPDKVRGLSADLLRHHHDEIYAGAVKKLNAISEELAKLDFNEASPEQVAKLKSEELAAYNSTILHELYFDGIGEAPSQPSGLLGQAIARDFSSYDRWRSEFMAAGRSLAGSDGWVLLVHSPRDKRLYNHRTAGLAAAPAGSVPLLALEVCEHAYEADYGTDVAKYVEAFMQLIKWTNAERLYREAMRI